jgi:hypothetical protein
MTKAQAINTSNKIKGRFKTAYMCITINLDLNYLFDPDLRSRASS